MRRSRLLCSVLAAVLGTLATAHAAGLRVNATASMPLGLWRLVARPALLQRGQIVTVCLPDTAPIRAAHRRGYIPAGFCLGGLEPLVKPVAAIGGDLVAVAASGVAVNGRAVAGTAPSAFDGAGRPLQPFPAGVYQVEPGSVWLLSGYDVRSFDSRYFGPVPVASVQGVAEPVWVLR